MDQAQLIAEQESNIRVQKGLVEQRTQQLKDAVTKYDTLMHDVGDAIPALRRSDVKDDPAVKKLLDQFAWIK